ncbi:hypothetical protein [Microbacterium sp. H1-D42]|uniref:hypothetical protein n=1 Tax=Microbacterium sp. H1-D42 TaxID=2925844 RepID=UPI001F5342B1|nr:hypothetical protein [Microbacterium sp. H1-D42]UNK70991.1 hypothetical protein MNR00_00680 [Microbacterium sp. H1-D42]
MPFLSDNEFSCGHHGFWGKVCATTLHSTVCELAGVEIPSDRWRASADRENDPAEQHNLIDDRSQAELRVELHHHLTEWYATRAREGMEGWNHDVRGFGQVHPVSRGLPETLTYATTPAPDGNSETD